MFVSLPCKLSDAFSLQSRSPRMNPAKHCLGCLPSDQACLRGLSLSQFSVSCLAGSRQAGGCCSFSDRVAASPGGRKCLKAEDHQLGQDLPLGIRRLTRGCLQETLLQVPGHTCLPPWWEAGNLRSMGDAKEYSQSPFRRQLDLQRPVSQGEQHACPSFCFRFRKGSDVK